MNAHIPGYNVKNTSKKQICDQRLSKDKELIKLYFNVLFFDQELSFFLETRNKYSFKDILDKIEEKIKTKLYILYYNDIIIDTRERISNIIKNDNYNISIRIIKNIKFFLDTENDVDLFDENIISLLNKKDILVEQLLDIIEKKLYTTMCLVYYNNRQLLLEDSLIGIIRENTGIHDNIYFIIKIIPFIRFILLSGEEIILDDLDFRYNDKLRNDLDNILETRSYKLLYNGKEIKNKKNELNMTLYSKVCKSKKADKLFNVLEFNDIQYEVQIVILQKFEVNNLFSSSLYDKLLELTADNINIDEIDNYNFNENLVEYKNGVELIKVHNSIECRCNTEYCPCNHYYKFIGKDQCCNLFTTKFSDICIVCANKFRYYIYMIYENINYCRNVIERNKMTITEYRHSKKKVPLIYDTLSYNIFKKYENLIILWFIGWDKNSTYFDNRLQIPNSNFSL